MGRVMILRRVMEHVKAQDWFAVALDFLIVVVGVFMGLQVQEWNQERKEAVQEHKYLERLHAEVETALSSIEVQFKFQKVVHESLVGALDALREESRTQQLTGNQCTSIYFSHIYDDAVLLLPTVNELLTSGRLSVLSHDNLRRMLAAHVQAIDGIEDTIDGMQVDRIVITSKYPALVDVPVDFHDFSVVEEAFGAGEFASNATCDLNAMRSTLGFKNDLIDNTSRHDYYFLFLTRQRNALTEIHDELDQILLLAHSKDPV